jgi:hypothetical protein
MPVERLPDVKPVGKNRPHSFMPGPAGGPFRTGYTGVTMKHRSGNPGGKLRKDYLVIKIKTFHVVVPMSAGFTGIHFVEKECKASKMAERLRLAGEIERFSFNAIHILAGKRNLVGHTIGNFRPERHPRLVQPVPKRLEHIVNVKGGLRFTKIRPYLHGKFVILGFVVVTV